MYSIKMYNWTNWFVSDQLLCKTSFDLSGYVMFEDVAGDHVKGWREKLSRSAGVKGLVEAEKGPRIGNSTRGPNLKGMKAWEGVERGWVWFLTQRIRN
jgi:hypothetical protein